MTSRNLSTDRLLQLFKATRMQVISPNCCGAKVATQNTKRTRVCYAKNHHIITTTIKKWRHSQTSAHGSTQWITMVVVVRIFGIIMMFGIRGKQTTLSGCDARYAAMTIHRNRLKLKIDQNTPTQRTVTIPLHHKQPHSIQRGLVWGAKTTPKPQGPNVHVHSFRIGKHKIIAFNMHPMASD